jgi:hypothetical protein
MSSVYLKYFLIIALLPTKCHFLNKIFFAPCNRLLKVAFWETKSHSLNHLKFLMPFSSRQLNSSSQSYFYAGRPKTQKIFWKSISSRHPPPAHAQFERISKLLILRDYFAQRIVGQMVVFCRVNDYISKITRTFLLFMSFKLFLELYVGGFRNCHVIVPTTKILHPEKISFPNASHSVLRGSDVLVRHPPLDHLTTSTLRLTVSPPELNRR